MDENFLGGELNRALVALTLAAPNIPHPMPLTRRSLSQLSLSPMVAPERSLFSFGLSDNLDGLVRSRSMNQYSHMVI